LCQVSNSVLMPSNELTNTPFLFQRNREDVRFSWFFDSLLDFSQIAQLPCIGNLLRLSWPLSSASCSFYVQPTGVEMTKHGVNFAIFQVDLTLYSSLYTVHCLTRPHSSPESHWLKREARTRPGRVTRSHFPRKLRTFTLIVSAALKDFSESLTAWLNGQHFFFMAKKCLHEGSITSLHA